MVEICIVLSPDILERDLVLALTAQPDTATGTEVIKRLYMYVYTQKRIWYFMNSFPNYLRMHLLGDDFDSIISPVTFEASVTSGRECSLILIEDDNVYEADEQFNVTCPECEDRTTIVIQDDDSKYG